MAFFVNVPASDVPHQFLTAGHCSVGSNSTWLHNGVVIGHKKDTSLYHAGDIDIMRIGVDDGTSNMSKKISDEPGYPYDLFSSALSPVQGELVCTSLESRITSVAGTSLTRP